MLSGRHFGRIILVAVVICLAAAAGAQEADPKPSGQGQLLIGQWNNVTVQDVAGWKYENVSLFWAGDGQVLRMRRPDGAVRDFNPEDIAKVVDQTGRNITALVAEGRFVEGQSPLGEGRTQGTAPGYNEVGVVGGLQELKLGDIVSPKPFDFSIDAGLGYGKGSGAWYDGTEAGLNYQIGLRASISRKSYLRILYRHQDFGEASFSDPYDEMFPVYRIKMSGETFMMLIGFHSGYQPNTKVRSLAYFEFGPAVIRQMADVEHFSHYSDSISRWGLAGNLGFLFPLGEVVALDMGVDLLHRPGWLTGNEAGGLLMGAHAGFAILN